MYIVIMDDKVVQGKTLSMINVKLGKEIKVRDEDFKYVGKDKVLLMSKEDISFIKDRKEMSRICLSRLYKKDSMPQYLLIVVLLLQFIMLIKG